MALWIVCNRLLNEVMNLRCVREEGHSGLCSYKYKREEREEFVDWDRVFLK